MIFKHEPDIIPWTGPIPEELQRMLGDYVVIVNHLLALGLYHKVGLEEHYYPLADGDGTGERKKIPPDRELRDLAKDWFVEYYKSIYKVHYLDSAASFAMQLIKSWRSNGGDINRLPYLRKPIARLNNDLYSIERSKKDGSLRLKVTIAPHKFVTMNIKVEHRHFVEWSKNRPGALVILPSGLRLCFTDDSPVKRSKKTVAYDFNFKRVIFSKDNGEQLESDLSDVMAIQENHRRKRISVQRTLRHNPAKAQRLLEKNRGRETNRVDDRLHKKIHGRDSEIKGFIQGHHLGVEDLTGITQDILKDDHGRRFNVRMSSWIHGKFADIITHHHPDSELYYTRGTSRYCPFDGSPVTHPSWKESKCPVCDVTYDRDWLESVHGLVRTLPPRHKKGQKWKTAGEVLPKKVVERLKRQSRITFKPTDVGMGTSLTKRSSLFALNVPSSVQSKSDTGIGQRTDVVLGNRYDAVHSNECAKKLGYDANDEVGERHVRFST